MNAKIGVAAIALIGSLAVPAHRVTAADSPAVERGRYLVTVGGCNDCHTAGFMEQGLRIPEADRLTGMAVGFQGPWGTTYAANLRVLASSLTEAEWMVRARQDRLPPMPSYILQSMKDDDLKAVYAYLLRLGPAGAAAPAYVAPGGRVQTPYFVFVPQTDEKRAAAR